MNRCDKYPEFKKFFDEYKQLCLKYKCFVAALDHHIEDVTGCSEGKDCGLSNKEVEFGLSYYLTRLESRLDDEMIDGVLN